MCLTEFHFIELIATFSLLKELHSRTSQLLLSKRKVRIVFFSPFNLLNVLASWPHVLKGELFSVHGIISYPVGTHLSIDVLWFQVDPDGSFLVWVGIVRSAVSAWMWTERASLVIEPSHTFTCTVAHLQLRHPDPSHMKTYKWKMLLHIESRWKIFDWCQLKHWIVYESRCLICSVKTRNKLMLFFSNLCVKNQKQTYYFL